MNRLNQHYHPSLQLASLILQCMGITQDFGIAEGNGFLLNMNQLFEKFVYCKLRKLLKADGIEVRAQTSRSFDAQKLARIQPDLIVKGPNGQRIVADTKYKTGTKPEPSDLYQMLTYCRVLGIANGVLLTVGKEQERLYEVLDGFTTIEVIPMDLRGTITDIDDSLLRLVSRLRELVQHRPVSG